MDSRSIKKLLEAGWRIIRLDDSAKAIKVMTYIQAPDGSRCNGWKYLEKGFESKAAMQKRFNELMEDSKTING